MNNTITIEEAKELMFLQRDEAVEIIIKLQDQRAELRKLLQNLRCTWLRAIDEELVNTHLGIASETDTYEVAKQKLSSLFSWHISVNDYMKNQGG